MGAARRDDLRARIAAQAASLLAEQGPGAVTTRRVAEASGVQAPTIYRLFGDKDGLLEAVAEHAMAKQASAKGLIASSAAARGTHPLDDLRDGWDSQIEFGLANPTLFRLLSDPERVRSSPAARAGREVLAGRINRLGAAGSLRVTERRATDLVQAAGIGVIQSLLSTPEHDRDPDLADSIYDAILAQILTDAPTRTGEDAVTAAAVTLLAAAPQLSRLSDGERRLFAEWLTRILQGDGRD